MRLRWLAPVLALLWLNTSVFGVEPPSWLPRYDMAIHIDVDGQTAYVTQYVTWTNYHKRSAEEIVFNAHSHLVPPCNPKDYLFVAKMLELMRVPASQGIYSQRALDLQRLYLLKKNGKEVEQVELKHRCVDNAYCTAWHVAIPEPVQTGESITIGMDFVFHFPQRQGRWGQWKGVTFLTNWSPVVAYFDEDGWHPTPFVVWHQPFFNEAGIFNVHVRLPADQIIAHTGSVREKKTDCAIQDVWIGPVVARSFDFLCSKRYQESCGQVGHVKVKVLAFPEHEHYAQVIVGIVCRAIETYSKWFGPFPYPEFTIAESYFGWNGNECAGLVMIDERVFGMPHLMENYGEYLVSHETCHQWFYNIIGTDGYRETFMDEAFATYFAHRLLDQNRGRNNTLIQWPQELEWMPNIRREDYRFSSFFGTLNRRELLPPLAEMNEYKHVGNLFSAAYDRGSKIVGLIEARLGEAAFFDFMRRIYQRYYFKVIRAKDLKKELEEYTGQNWDEFFKHWLYSADMTDWSIHCVQVDKIKTNGEIGKKDFLSVFKKEAEGGPYRYRITLKQKAEYNATTDLGFSFDNGQTYTLRVPIVPQSGVVNIEDPPARIEALEDNQIRVEIILPQRVGQINVDPDKLLPDSNPANNFWKPEPRINFTPAYTMLDETGLTTAYDRWNVTLGPWVYSPTFIDPWFTRASVIGLRAGAYRTDHFQGGAYLGYRTDYQDLALGLDAVWKGFVPKVDFGVHAEKSLVTLGDDTNDLDRAVVYSRYIITPASSLYTAPIHHVEGFAAWQRNFLPDLNKPIPGAKKFDHLSQLGVHYHLDLLTPYWDPEIGFRLDVTYAAGFPILRQPEMSHQLFGQISGVFKPPEQWGWGWFGRSKLAVRAYGAVASPDDALLYSLGGNLLFRGFDMAERQGSAVWIGSVELRLPIVQEAQVDVLDHTLGLRNFYIAPFYDVGEAYVNSRSAGGVAHAVGVGLRADVAWFSFIERTTLRLDVAKTVNEATGTQIWLGITHPF